MSEILVINDQSVSVTDDEQMQRLEDELQAKVLIRTIDDENDSDYEDVDDDDGEEVEEIPIIKKDDDNQNVPNIQSKDNQKPLDDDNNTQSPAYVPRKGKFYEHDDRTIDDDHRTKSDFSKNKSHLYRDFGGKWQHDLYFQDQKQIQSQRSHSHTHNRERFHLNDYMSRSNQTHRQPTREGNQNRMTNFECKDYHHNTFNQQQTDERTFHRRRNFTNSHFQQQDRPLKDNFPRKTHQINRDFDKYELTNNLPSRLQSNIERPKRYSNMRNNSNQQRSSFTKTSNSNAKDQNEWPQAPPPPTASSFLSQQLITPQMFYQQQTSRYVPLNYPQTSISDQFQASK